LDAIYDFDRSYVRVPPKSQLTETFSILFVEIAPPPNPKMYNDYAEVQQEIKKEKQEPMHDSRRGSSPAVDHQRRKSQSSDFGSLLPNPPAALPEAFDISEGANELNKSRNQTFSVAEKPTRPAPRVPDNKAPQNSQKTSPERTSGSLNRPSSGSQSLEQAIPPIPLNFPPPPPIDLNSEPNHKIQGEFQNSSFPIIYQTDFEFDPNMPLPFPEIPLADLPPPPPFPGDQADSEIPSFANQQPPHLMNPPDCTSAPTPSASSTAHGIAAVRLSMLLPPPPPFLEGSELFQSSDFSTLDAAGIHPIGEICASNSISSRSPSVPLQIPNTIPDPFVQDLPPPPPLPENLDSLPSDINSNSWANIPLPPSISDDNTLKVSPFPLENAFPVPAASSEPLPPPPLSSDISSYTGRHRASLNGIYSEKIPLFPSQILDNSPFALIVGPDSVNVCIKPPTLVSEEERVRNEASQSHLTCGESRRGSTSTKSPTVSDLDLQSQESLSDPALNGATKESGIAQIMSTFTPDQKKIFKMLLNENRALKDTVKKLKGVVASHGLPYE
jgi:hypothetical protein